MLKWSHVAIVHFIYGLCLAFYFLGYKKCAFIFIFIIMMSETCINHKLLLVTENIFCSNPKANGKILLGFWWGNQGHVNLRIGLQKYVTAALYSKCS